MAKLTESNFALYEKLNLPMLMMFLDLQHEDVTSSPGRVVGGRSGGVLNEDLLEELRAVAKVVLLSAFAEEMCGPSCVQLISVINSVLVHFEGASR